MANKDLGDFLLERCKERRLSLRRLSISSGLSAGTVHNIIKRQYQPTLFSLNRLADYLGVKRQYLWQLAGLLEDMDYDTQTTFGDPRMRFYFAQADKLPESARNLVISIIASIVAYLNSGGQIFKHGKTFSFSGDNKGLTCPFEMAVCEVGYCERCEKYLQWRRGNNLP